MIPRENHNPIEMHATIAAWDGDRLTLWDKTQWVHNTADEIAAVFGIPAENIRVISPFVGGAFGSGLRTWPHVTLAALGARVARRPVKLMLSRREMYYSVGYRPHTVQRVALGASRDGRLAAIVHDGYQETSTYEEFSEALLNASRFLHSSPNVFTRHRIARMNAHTPTYMRAPGEASGLFALESAMDELAVALNADPVELRLRNEPEQDEFKKLPFSSRSTRECYRVAAERFGWGRRNPEPRSMRDGRWLIGWGMATATYPMNYAPASAMARLLPDGTAEVTSASSDMGPGTWTSMTQVAAETLGLPIERVVAVPRHLALRVGVRKQARALIVGPVLDDSFGALLHHQAIEAVVGANRHRPFRVHRLSGAAARIPGRVPGVAQGVALFHRAAECIELRGFRDLDHRAVGHFLAADESLRVPLGVELHFLLVAQSVPYHLLAVRSVVMVGRLMAERVDHRHQVSDAVIVVARYQLPRSRSGGAGIPEHLHRLLAAA